MKLFWFISITPFIFSQNIHDKMDSLFTPLEKYYYNSATTFLTQKNSESEKLLKEIYDIYSYHWIEESKYQEERLKKYDGLNKAMPPVIGILSRNINNIYGDNYYQIITCPYYLKTKIINIDPDNNYESLESNLFLKTTFTCEILEVIKGAHKFNKGELIEISFLQHWETSEHLIENGIYFMPVKPWHCKNGECTEYTLNYFPPKDTWITDAPFTIYTIHDNNISGVEFFKLPSNEWIDFKNEFQNKYILED